jgi:hypothetical protein
MADDAAEVERRIAAAEGELVGPATGDAARRAARTALAKLLAMRYVRFDGPDTDRERAEEIIRDVLADPEATPGERQDLALLRSTLTMLAVTPAHLMRGSNAGSAVDPVGASREWQQAVDPAAMLAGFSRLAEQLAAVPDREALPPQIRSVLDLVGGMTALLQESRNDDWDGTLSPALQDRLGKAVADAPADVPGLDLVRGVVTWLSPQAQGRVADLEATLAGLSADHLLTPVLRGDLAREFAERAEKDGAEKLPHAVELLEQAVAGMGADHPLRAETVRMLAGAVLAREGLAPSADGAARATQLAEEVVGSGAARSRGADLFLRAMVGVLRSRLTGDRGAADARGDLLEAIRLLPSDDPLRPVAIGQLGALLADRRLTEGSLAAGEASSAVLDDALRTVPADDEGAAFLACVAAVTRVNRAVLVDDLRGAEAGAAELRASLSRLPPQHPVRSNLELVLAVVGLKVEVAAGDRLRIRSAADALRRAASAPTLAGVAPAAAAGIAGTVDVLAGLLDHDSAAVTASIERMEAGLDEPVALPDERVARRALLGKAYLAAAASGLPEQEMARRAVGHLTEAVRLLGMRRPGVQLHALLLDLATAYRITGDAGAARKAGFDALEALAGDVLLQTGAAHAVVTARGAADEAARLARWCLADREPESAVQAIELGRGLALHAATSSLHVPDLLADAGHSDLADAWRRAQVTDATEGPIDYAGVAGDLRHQVLDVLRGLPAARRLFTAPAAVEIDTALRAVGADALVHLVPGDRTDEGYLLVIRVGAPPVSIAAPTLRVGPEGPLADFLDRSPSDRLQEWRDALSAVCDWSGSVVVAPLLETLRGLKGSGPDGLPRVVLVPGGPLGAVPWPAARRTDAEGVVRYACADLVLSTAASARQLVDVAARPRLPLEQEPVLLAGPAPDLAGVRAEVAALAARYGTARVLGPGTPQAEVVAALQAASLLQVSCHAVVGATPDASHLVLDEPLPVRLILDRAATRRVTAPGPTVVLSACSSDLTERDHDEALTLATAFLVAGAVTVVASRWPVNDRLTAVSMIALHHFLGTGLPAADALRATQLWLLDPARPPLPGMSAREARRGALVDISVWAAFGHQGR